MTPGPAERKALVRDAIARRWPSEPRAEEFIARLRRIQRLARGARTINAATVCHETGWSRVEVYKLLASRVACDLGFYLSTTASLNSISLPEAVAWPRWQEAYEYETRIS